MNPLRAIWSKLRSLGQRRAVKQEIDEELRFHVEQRTAENIAAGMSPEEAARAARKRFGNLQSLREECRDMRGVSFGETLLQDLRYGARGLWNNRGFTSVAVVSLALGIGATTTVFSLANAVLLRPLPVKDAATLVSVNKIGSDGNRIHVISYPDYVDYCSRNDVFSELLAWSEAPLSLNLDGQVEQAYGMVVSGNYFATLGVQPAVGRFFTLEEDRTPGAHPVAVISFALWQSHFGGDPSVIGQNIKLKGHSFTIIGVAPKEFTSTYNLFAPALYVPLMMQAQVLSNPNIFGARMDKYLKLTGRLRPGVTREQAQAALSVLDRQLEQAYPQKGETSKRPHLGVELVPVGSFPGEIRLAILGAASLLLAIVGFVLLIACANVAAMLMARATVRQREIAVRLALGATRRRLIRQLLTERMAALPGVEAVSLARNPSLGLGYNTTGLEVKDAPQEGNLQAQSDVVAPHYFETLGITFLAGRDFTPADREAAPRVVIINEAMARRFWPGASALGKQVSAGEDGWAEVIGVVENGRHRISGQAPPPFVYRPFLQSQSDNLDLTLLLRHRGETATLLTAVRREVQTLDPNLPLQSPMTLSEAVRLVTLPWHVVGLVTNVFGLIGLALAAFGIYGLVSYTINQRTQEIGVRIALGAQRRDIFTLVIGQGLKLALLGVAVGLALSFGLARALNGFALWGERQRPRDLPEHFVAARVGGAGSDFDSGTPGGERRSDDCAQTRMKSDLNHEKLFPIRVMNLFSAI